MPLKIFQKGFNYSQDGRGNRLVYHLQGCNMHCPWCSNPEGMAAAPHKTLKPLLEYTAEELLKEALSCRVMFFDGGGITFTGGEPTLQFGGLKEALQALKDNGFHTAMECNATHPQLPELFPYIDQLIMDFKHWNSETHRKITGVGNEVIRKNIAEAFAKHGDVLIRTVLVHGFNDTREDAESFARFYRQFDTAHARFEFLPYHVYGKVKWEQCGLVYTVADGYVGDDVPRIYREIYEQNGLTVVRT